MDSVSNNNPNYFALNSPAISRATGFLNSIADLAIFIRKIDKTDYLMIPVSEITKYRHQENSNMTVPGYNNRDAEITPRSNLVIDNPVPEDHDILAKLKHAVLSNLNNSNYSIQDICLELHLSRSWLHKKVKQLSGKSVSHYIRSIRIEAAKELLLNKDLRVCEVGYDVGFSDPSYFCRVFTLSTGISPSAWRDNHLN